VAPTSGIWTPEPFEADDGTVPFARFVNNLSDFKFTALDASIDRVLSVRGIDLARTEWLRPLGKGVHEFRVRHDVNEIAHMFGGDPPQAAAPAVTILLRVFVHFYGDKAILLLGGYDKGEDPTESRRRREIAEARRLLAQFKERQRRQRGRASRPKKRKRRS
jgi:putative component of toxin-antitoxin plasmid stabilization module